MHKILFFLAAAGCVMMSCTRDKTDYIAEIDYTIPENTGFQEVVAIHEDNYRIQINALNGILYKGYNEIRIRITDVHAREEVEGASVSFVPVMNNIDEDLVSCPHRHTLVYQTEGNYYAGYAVFTSESMVGAWDLYISFTIEDRPYVVKQSVDIAEQPNQNLNMTSFAGSDGYEYIIALIEPQKPRVAENKLVAGIFRRDNAVSVSNDMFSDLSPYTYSVVEGYTLLLDPRMPEPSMGNHSSPNNKDLMQKEDGFYEGVVNYTMTGNWTLNFILLNESGQIVKGDVVPDDFTPGVEGVKSELHIDVLF